MTYKPKAILQQDLIGNTRNGYTDKEFTFTFGKNSDIDNAIEDLWEGPTATYVFPASAIQMQVVSSDNTNDKSGGTGALTVEIHYLDSDYKEQTEVVTLNGTTAVNTVATNILRVNSFHVKTAGSTGVNAGNISLRNTAGSVTYAYITAGFNYARQAIFTVPAGKTLYISHWQASSGSAGNHFCQIVLSSSSHNGELLSSGVFLPLDEIGSQNGGGNVTLPIPIKVPATADVKLSAISDGASANVIALGSVMGWFELN